MSPSQRPLPDNTQHLQQTNIHTPGGFRTHDRSRRVAVDLRFRLRGYWDQHVVIKGPNYSSFVTKLISQFIVSYFLGHILFLKRV